MDPYFPQAFVSSTQNTFETMLKIKLQPGKPQQKAGSFPSYDISGIIGLSGDAIGSVSLSFPKSVALNAVAALLGTEVKTITAEVVDAVGELTNIVAGSAKVLLVPLRLSISLPSVVVGVNHQLAASQGVETVVVPFVSDLGHLALEISLKA